MSKINATKKYVLDDFPSDVRKWLSKLINPLNQFNEQVYSALTSGLTVADNLKCQRYNQSIEIGQTVLKLSYNLNEKPSIVHAQVSSLDGSAVPPYSTVQYLNNGVLEVTITGLNALLKYNVIIIAQV